MGRIVAAVLLPRSPGPGAGVWSDDDVAGVAEVAMAFGPTVAVTPPLVWIDITGVAHLFGGEEALAKQLDEKWTAVGYRVAVAIADGPRTAAAVARGTLAPFTLVPPGEGESRRALGSLPLRVLRWALGDHSLSDDDLLFLTRMGCRTVRDVDALPRGQLAARLRSPLRAAHVLAFLAGEDRDPLRPYLPVEIPEVRVELEYGTSSLEALGFVIKGLCQRLAARLEGRGQGVSTLELVLELDRAFAEGDPRQVLTFVFPSPLRQGAELFAVVRARAEGTSLKAPVRALVLRGLRLAEVGRPTLPLLEAESIAARVLPRLTAELEADLGEGRVGVLRLQNTWVPERRSLLVPYDGGLPGSPPRVPLVSGAPEPLRLTPVVPWSEGEPLRFVVRLEAQEWWLTPVAPTVQPSHEVANDNLDAAGGFRGVRWEFAEGFVPGAGLAWVRVNPATGEKDIVGWLE